jgi:hypothetical protein
MMMPKSGVGDLLLKARRRKAAAMANPNDMLAPIECRRADEQIEQALVELPEGTANVGAGGELVLLAASGALAPFRNTVERPNFVTVDASAERQQLAYEAGALELGLDIAETIQPTNSLERMLSHELAAVHRVGMKFVGRVNDGLEYIKANGETPQLNAMLARNIAAADRMFGRFQAGALALHRIRSGNRQHVTVEHVQHVQVTEGGQAVIAGRVNQGPRRKHRGGGVKNE